jgi:transposase
MNIDPVIKNDIVARWLNHQSLRSIANDTQIGRKIVARVIRQHTAQTQSIDADAAPACFGPVALTRKSKLGPFLEALQQLLARYPNIIAQRAFEELCKLGYQGSYSTLRTFMKRHRSKPKAPVIRFETLPGAQAQSRSVQRPI